MKKEILLLLLIILCSGMLYAQNSVSNEKEINFTAKEASSVPVIDGKALDKCWEEAEWYQIDQVWIPWGGNMDPADFSGRFKVCWSSVTDRIYFLVEITDDVLVDGYKYPMPQYHNWDVVEIFFDEDASGGDHTLNQNAFAYHISCGNENTEFEAMDLTAGWKAMNYSSHLDCVIEQDEEDRYIWEISMTVYNDNYNPNRSSNPTEQLVAGKVSGLSLAYCDNDDPSENPKMRDNFIGTIYVPKANFNDHWQNADWFGRLKLVK